MPDQVNVWKVLKLRIQLPHKQALSGAGVDSSMQLELLVAI